MFVSKLVLPILVTTVGLAAAAEHPCEFKKNCPDGSDTECWGKHPESICRNGQDCIDWGQCDASDETCCCVNYLPYPYTGMGGYCGVKGTQGGGGNDGMCNDWLGCIDLPTKSTAMDDSAEGADGGGEQCADAEYYRKLVDSLIEDGCAGLKAADSDGVAPAQSPTPGSGASAKVAAAAACATATVAAVAAVGL